MNQQLLKRAIFCLIAIKWLICSAIAQNSKQTLQFADSLYKNHNYNSAIKEYQRLMFFDDGRHEGYLQIQMANCRFEMQKYAEAAKHYQFAYYIADNDSLKNELLFKRATCFIKTHNYRFALPELFSVNDSLSVYHYQKQRFYLGMSYFALEQFKNSETAFIQSIDSACTMQIDAINHVFRSKKIHRPNPAVAFWLSVFFPGTGQLYCGDVKNAVNSFTLLSGISVAGVLVSQQLSFVNALLAIAPLFLRYYRGGIKQAVHIAEYKRLQHRNEILNQIIQIISSTKIK